MVFIFTGKPGISQADSGILNYKFVNTPLNYYLIQVPGFRLYNFAGKSLLWEKRWKSLVNSVIFTFLLEWSYREPVSRDPDEDG